MKTLALLTTLIFSVSVFATPSPYSPSSVKLISSGAMNLPSGQVMVGNSAGKAKPVAVSGDVTMSNLGVVLMSDASEDGLMRKRFARVTYDIADTGNDSTGDAALGVTIPANSIITRSWFYTVTQFTDGGAGTVALSCEDAGNILPAQDITGITAGSFTDASQDGAIANFKGGIAADCEVTATVATAAQTAGKLILFLEYFVGE